MARHRFVCKQQNLRGLSLRSAVATKTEIDAAESQPSAPVTIAVS
jgi:hypothetical protein